jgi:hypothetical protein
MYKYIRNTIKCWCGWDSKIPNPNHMVIRDDIICPKCGAVVVHGSHPKPYPKPKPWGWPWRKERYWWSNAV